MSIIINNEDELAAWNGYSNIIFNYHGFTIVKPWTPVPILANCDINGNYANIIIDSTTKSQGIKVLNMRTFGYVVEPSEMQARMSDLILKRLINPPPIVL